MKKHVPEEASVIFLTRGQLEDGDAFWAYLMVSLYRLEAYFQARSSGAPFAMQDYGDILSWGRGQEPPQVVREEMETVYHVKHDLQEQVRKRLEATEEGRKLIAQVKREATLLQRNIRP